MENKDLALQALLQASQVAVLEITWAWEPRWEPEWDDRELEVQSGSQKQILEGNLVQCSNILT